MCDKANRAEKPEARVAAQVATQVAAAATATLQVAGQVAAHKDVATATAKATAHKDADSKKAQVVDPEFARAENEDDDGYDPYSDRRPVSDPLFERDPWS